MGKLFGAVEIGGTKQQLAVVDESGRIVEQICEKFPHPNGVADRISCSRAGLRSALARAPWWSTTL